MSDLKALIKGLRQENVHHRRFVPELSLRRAITKTVVRRALEDSGRFLQGVFCLLDALRTVRPVAIRCALGTSFVLSACSRIEMLILVHQLGISIHLQKEITTRIIRSGRRIFAVLVLIDQAADVLRFIEADELQDVKLPFKIEVLRNEVSIPNADDFDEKQWEFAAPTFVRGTLNRCFREKTILPFAAKSDEGRGAFGKVYKIQLQQDHQGSDSRFPQEVSDLNCVLYCLIGFPSLSRRN